MASKNDTGYVIAVTASVAIGAVTLLRPVVEDAYKANNINKEYKKYGYEERVNVFNVEKAASYELEPYTHEVGCSFIFLRSDVLDQVPVPEGYTIKSYEIHQIIQDGTKKYLYYVVFTNEKKVLVSGTYDYNSNSIVYDQFGIVVKDKQLKK